MKRVSVTVVITDEKGNQFSGAKSTSLNGEYTRKMAEWATGKKAAEAFRDAAYAGSLFDFKKD